MAEFPYLVYPKIVPYKVRLSEELIEDATEFTQSLGDLMSRATTELLAQKEAWLLETMRTLGVSLDEFARDYIIEEYPSEITNVAKSVFESEGIFQIRQNYRIKRKTDKDRERGL